MLNQACSATVTYKNMKILYAAVEHYISESKSRCRSGYTDVQAGLHFYSKCKENQAPRLYSAQLSKKFILLINVKMPTIVGILTFISMINTTSERLIKQETSLLVDILVFMSS